MMEWFPLLCLLGLGITLTLVLRQHCSLARKSVSALLQVAVWFLVWSLFQPPALVSSDPGASEKTLPIGGDGLSRNALRDWAPVRLHPGAPAAGAAWKPEWQREVSLGEPLELHIQLSDGYQHPARLTLEDPFGSDVSSALLSAESPTATLAAWPKLPGNWQYRVRIETENPAAAENTIRSEALPVAVRSPQSPRVLLWLARPGFESAALARWLRQSGTPAQVVTQLAPEIQRRETYNGQPLRETRLLGAGSPFDLLILDSRLWPQLTAAQRQQLAALAENKSLLWLMDENSPQGFTDYARAQGMALAKVASTSAAYGDTAGGGEIPTLQLAGYRPSQIRAGDAQITAGERTLYWARVTPQQSLGFVFFRNSYRWQTAGFAAEFALLWKQLLDRQLAQRGSQVPVTLSTELPRAQQRVTLCSSGFGEVPAPLQAADSSTVDPVPPPLRGLPAGSSEDGRCYSYWPQREGWHRIEALDFGFYVFAESAWPQWQRAISREDTAQMAAARLGPQSAHRDDKAALPLPWIVLALLVLLTVTWWRERATLH